MSGEEQNDILANNQNEEEDSERPTDIKNNNKGRFTEVESDFLFYQKQEFGGSTNIGSNPNISSGETTEQETKEQGNTGATTENNQSSLINANKQLYTTKIIILGDIALGKTSIINRFISNSFS